MSIAFLTCALAINLLAYGTMALGKRRAANGPSHIRETTLLNLALLGYSLGIAAAQRTIRHKTRERPFRSRLRIILTLQAVAIGALALVLGPETFSAHLPF